MTNQQRHTLVERYTAGLMSGNEEQDFFIQVAVDDELRHMLKAHSIVENALRKDKDLTPVPSPNARARVAFILRNSSSPAGRLVGSSTLDAAATGTTAATTVSGGMSGTMKGLLGIVTTSALIIGATFFMDTPQHEPAPSSPDAVNGRSTLTVPVIEDDAPATSGETGINQNRSVVQTSAGSEADTDESRLANSSDAFPVELIEETSPEIMDDESEATPTTLISTPPASAISNNGPVDTIILPSDSTAQTAQRPTPQTMTAPVDSIRLNVDFSHPENDFQKQE